MSDCGGGGGGGDNGGGGCDSGGGWFGNNNDNNDNGGGGGWYGSDNDNGHHHSNGDGTGNASPWLVTAFCSGCASLIGLIVGLVFLTMSIMKEIRWTSVTGIIVGNHYCGCDSGSGSSKNRGGCQDLYSAMIEYVVDGITYIFTETSCSSGIPTTGKEIRVLFDPNDPGEGVTGGFLGLWLIPTIGLSLGVIFCCIFSAVVSKRPISA